MAHRLFLHIGPPKTGTSYIQSLCHANRDELAARGLLYPGEAKDAQFHASAVVTERTSVLRLMTDFERGAWRRLTRQAQEWSGDVLLSSEHYARGSDEHVPPVHARLAEVADEVHLVVTARDLARQVVAAWQQRVKYGSAHTFREEWTLLAQDPTDRFWTTHDLPRLIERWRGALPADRVHLIAHGPAGTPHDLLWQRFCDVVGIDPDLPHDAARSNESLGPVEVEFLRRVNAAMPRDRNAVPGARVTKGLFTRQLRSRSPYRDRLLITPEAHAWVAERGARMVDELRAMELTVHGDLDDLLVGPLPDTGRHPDEVTDEEVATLGVELAAGVVEHEVERRQEMKELRRELRALRRAHEARTP